MLQLNNDSKDLNNKDDKENNGETSSENRLE